MTTTLRKLDRTELRKRLEQRRHELTAKIKKAEADATAAAHSHVQVMKDTVEALDEAIGRGLEHLEEETIHRLSRLLDRDDDGTKSDD